MKIPQCRSESWIEQSALSRTATTHWLTLKLLPRWPGDERPVPLSIARRGQRSVARLPVPRRRHRDQQPVQDWHDLGADDLCPADLSNTQPRPLAQLSPWMDHLIAAPEQVYARLAIQDHRRFIKTHTPLDGIPLDPRATYIVTARQPLDMAVSLYHQGDNIDRARLRQLTAQPEPTTPPPLRQPLHEWLLEWIVNDAAPRSIWTRCPGSCGTFPMPGPDPQAERLASALRQSVRRLGGPDALARRSARDSRSGAGLALACASGHVQNMAARAHTLVPAAGILKSNAAFFRRGTSGEGRQILSDEEVAAYYARAAQLAPADMLTWLHSTGLRCPRTR